MHRRWLQLGLGATFVGALAVALATGDDRGLPTPGTVPAIALAAFGLVFFAGARTGHLGRVARFEPAGLARSVAVSWALGFALTLAFYDSDALRAVGWGGLWACFGNAASLGDLLRRRELAVAREPRGLRPTGP